MTNYAIKQSLKQVLREGGGDLFISCAPPPSTKMEEVKSSSHDYVSYIISNISNISLVLEASPTRSTKNYFYGYGQDQDQGVVYED